MCSWADGNLAHWAHESSKRTRHSVHGSANQNCVGAAKSMNLVKRWLVRTSEQLTAWWKNLKWTDKKQSPQSKNRRNGKSLEGQQVTTLLESSTPNSLRHAQNLDIHKGNDIFWTGNQLVYIQAKAKSVGEASLYLMLLVGRNLVNIRLVKYLLQPSRFVAHIMRARSYI